MWLFRVAFFYHHMFVPRHGLSEGNRLFVKDFSDYVDDVLSLIKKAKLENPGKKTFLFGHSMGGLISILTTLRDQSLFDGVIYSSPA